MAFSAVTIASDSVVQCPESAGVVPSKWYRFDHSRVVPRNVNDLTTFSDAASAMAVPPLSGVRHVTDSLRISLRASPGVGRTASYAYDGRTRARSAVGGSSQMRLGGHRSHGGAIGGGDEVERSSSSPPRLTEPPSALRAAEPEAASRVRRLRRELP